LSPSQGALDETFQALNTAEDGRDVLTVAVSAVIMEIDNHAKAEKAKLQAALDRANGDRTRLAYELATAKRQAQLLKAGEQQDGIVAA
jgi:hypothetical protein